MLHVLIRFLAFEQHKLTLPLSPILSLQLHFSLSLFHTSLSPIQSVAFIN